MLNKNMFISKMKLYGDTQQILADYIGISIQRLNAKINGAEFSQSEIEKIIIRYHLTGEEVIAIFFANVVSFQGLN